MDSGADIVGSRSSRSEVPLVRSLSSKSCASLVRSRSTSEDILEKKTLDVTDDEHTSSADDSPNKELEITESQWIKRCNFLNILGKCLKRIGSCVGNSMNQVIKYPLINYFTFFAVSVLFLVSYIRKCIRIDVNMYLHEASGYRDHQILWCCCCSKHLECNSFEHLNRKTVYAQVRTSRV